MWIPRSRSLLGLCFGSGRHCSIVSGSENSEPLSVSITENSFRIAAALEKNYRKKVTIDYY